MHQGHQYASRSQLSQTAPCPSGGARPGCCLDSALAARWRSHTASSPCIVPSSDGPCWRPCIISYLAVPSEDGNLRQLQLAAPAGAAVRRAGRCLSEGCAGRARRSGSRSGRSGSRCATWEDQCKESIGSCKQLLLCRSQSAGRLANERASPSASGLPQTGFLISCSPGEPDAAAWEPGAGDAPGQGPTTLTANSMPAQMCPVSWTSNRCSSAMQVQLLVRHFTERLPAWRRLTRDAVVANLRREVVLQQHRNSEPSNPAAACFGTVHAPRHAPCMDVLDF